MKALLAPAHYIYDNGERGSEFLHAYQVSHAIVNEWPESIVITGKSIIDYSPGYTLIEVQPHTDIDKITNSAAIKFSLRYSYATAKILLTQKIDIFHHVRPFQLGVTFNICALLGINGKTPFVIGSFCSPYRNELTNVGVMGSILKYLSKKTLEKAQVVYVYDSHTKKLVRDLLDHQNIQVIPPGIDGTKYHEKQPTKDFRIISVGYLVPRKRFDRLILAFKKISIQLPSASLTILGDGPEMQRLVRLTKSLNIQNKVTFPGFIENKKIAEYYSRSSIFACLQEEESFGQVYLEAMASSLPVVTTVNTGSTEIIGDKEFGYLVDTDDEAGFIEKVLKLARNPSLLKKYSKNAKKEFDDQYELKTITRKYVESYKQLLKDTESGVGELE